MRIKDICEANHYKVDKTFRHSRLPTLEPDPIDSAEPFDIGKHDQTTDRGPDIDITDAQVRAKVTQMLLTLPPKMERILRERFFQGMTLEQLSKKYGLSRERLRQIEGKALRMLKHPVRSNTLRPLLTTGNN
jgi:RNA polymerase primary sigma factor